MIQEAAQGRLALNLGLERRFCGVIKGQWNNIADSLVWAAGVVIFLNDGERAAQVGLTQQNQIIECRTYFPYVTSIVGGSHPPRKRLDVRRLNRWTLEITDGKLTVMAYSSCQSQLEFATHRVECLGHSPLFVIQIAYNFADWIRSRRSDGIFATHRERICILVTTRPSELD